MHKQPILEKIIEYILLNGKISLSYCFLAICVLANINLIFNSPVPSHFFLPRLCIDFISIAALILLGMLLIMAQNFFAKLLLIFLTIFAVIEDLLARTIQSLTLDGIILEVGTLNSSKLLAYYKPHLLLLLLALICTSFLLRHQEKINKKYFLLTLSSFLALLLVQIFIIFPSRPVRIALLPFWETHHIFPHLSPCYTWNDQEGRQHKYAMPMRPGTLMSVISQFRMTFPGIIGDLMAFQIVLLDGQALPHPESEKSLPSFVHKTSPPLADTIVLVVGESASSRHYSIFGYPLQTTPRLKTLLEQKNICTLNKVHSFADMTRLTVLPEISLYRLDNLEAARTEKSLLDIAHLQGFKTFWLSSTDDTGYWAGDIGNIGANADTIRASNIPKKGNKDTLPIKKNYSDEDVFKMAQKALDDPAEHKFIIIHLWGSHFPYAYDPQDRTELPQAKTYDLNTHRTDRHLSRLIEAINTLSKEKKQRTFFLYASDHGEVPHESYAGHYSLSYQGNDFLVPFIAAGTLSNEICRLTDKLRSPQGWFSTSLNKYILLSVLGYTTDPNIIDREKNEDKIMGADDRIYSWKDYYHPQEEASYP